MIEYFNAPDIKQRVQNIVDVLRFDHINQERIYCIRSRGSESKRTVARIHGLSRIWQEAMGIEPTYIIEVIHELFDFYPKEAQDKTLIHEIMHIPMGFKGGFRHHKDHVTNENVEVWYHRYRQRSRELDKR